MEALKHLFSLEGKTALVTGGATGIGRMVASSLASAGANVMIASRKGEDCQRVSAQLNDEGHSGHVEGFAGDVGSETGVYDLVERVKSSTDRLDILVNNAGVTWGQPLEEFPHAAWSKVLNVNVAGLFHLSKELLPMLSESASHEDPARVINLGSVMGTVAMGDGAYSYSASKAAVHHLTKILAKEWAEKRITVNAFAPGPFQSKMTAFATGTDEKAAKVGAGVPLGRIGHPDDIAGATLFLCGKGGAYITGAIIPLCGGTHVMTGRQLFND